MRKIILLASFALAGPKKVTFYKMANNYNPQISHLTTSLGTSIFVNEFVLAAPYALNMARWVGGKKIKPDSISKNNYFSYILPLNIIGDIEYEYNNYLFLHLELDILKSVYSLVNNNMIESLIIATFKLTPIGFIMPKFISWFEITLYPLIFLDTITRNSYISETTTSAFSYSATDKWNNYQSIGKKILGYFAFNIDFKFRINYSHSIVFRISIHPSLKIDSATHSTTENNINYYYTPAITISLLWHKNWDL